MKKSNLLVIAAAIAMVACSKDDASTSEISPEASSIASSENVELAFPNRQGVVQEGYLDGAAISYEKIGDSYVVEGDIILDKEDISETPTRSTGRTLRRWPNNTVYYDINPSLPNQARVTNAIAHWEQNTSLRFVRRTNQRNYIYFTPGGGCSSAVGMTGRRQNITLASGCSTGNTIHEIGHAVGLWHEQSRVDRDQYLNINFDNIPSNRRHNFQTYAQRGRDGAEYTAELDFGSIMMYHPYSFAINRRIPTITLKNGDTYRTQRNGLSQGDLSGIRQMYPSN